MFGQGKSTPRRLESVRNLCSLTNVVGRGHLGIAPTTRSKRSISRPCFGRLLYSVFSVKSPAFERTWSRAEVGMDVWTENEAADSFDIEVRAALVPLIHLV